MTKAMRPSFLDSLVFRFLTATYSHRNSVWARSWWFRIHRLFLARHRTIKFNLAGNQVLAPYGYTYPLIVREHRTFNAPLLQLVNETYRAKGRPLRLVDIGAAIGDTVLLVNAHCNNMVSQYICIDGDQEFFAYQEANLSAIPDVKLICTQLSRESGEAPSLVRIHAGTASAQGQQRTNAMSLDEVLTSKEIGAIDVLKIDVDGFDGAILAGARSRLANDRPDVIFEWHPILCRQTANEWSEAFATLTQAGYTRFIWFDKFGNFSHFDFCCDENTIAALAQYCLRDIGADWHFDVVALHGTSQLDFEALAGLNFAKSKQS